MHTPLSQTACLGYLRNPLRNYPLRAANLAAVLKAYAIEAKLPYTLNNQKFDELSDYKLYLTDAGLEWLLSVFNSIH